MEIEQEEEAMMDPEKPIPEESTLPSSNVRDETITDRVTDQGVVSVDTDAAISKLSAQGLTLETMLERLLLLEPLMIGTPQEESIVINPRIEPDEASHRRTINSQSPSTISSTGIGDVSKVCPGPVLVQDRGYDSDRMGAAAYAVFRSLETDVHGAGASSKASDCAVVIDSDNSGEEPGDEIRCGRPIAWIVSEEQKEREEDATFPSGDVQSRLTDLAQQNIEIRRSRPDLMPEIDGDERPDDGIMLGITSIARSVSVKVEKPNAQSSSPPVLSECGRSSISFSCEDKHNVVKFTPSTSIDPTTSKTHKGRLDHTAGGVCDIPRIWRKRPVTKRTRVAKSEKNASLRVHSGDGHENLVHEGIPDVASLAQGAGPLRKRQNVLPSKYTQQKPDSNTRAQPTPSSQTLELLQPQHFGKNERSSQSLGSENPRDGMIEHRRNDLDHGIEIPSTQLGENISKSKWKKMRARTRATNGPGEGSNDSIKQSGRNPRAQFCLPMITDHKGGPVSTSDRGVVASADKERPYHPGRSLAPPNGSGDGRSQAAAKEYDGSAGVVVQESESVLAGSESRQQNSLVLSSQHQQYLPAITEHLNPIVPHTDPDSYRSIEAPTPTTTTTSSAQASRRLGRVNRTSSASGHRPSGGDHMNTSRGAIPSVRGQSHARSSNQDENEALGSWPSSAPSVSSNSAPRRPRGFQPTEVGKSKSNLNTAVTSIVPPKAEAVTQHREPATTLKSNLMVDVEVTPSVPRQAEAVTQPQQSANSPSQPEIEALPKNSQAESPATLEILTTSLLGQTTHKQHEVIPELLAKACSPRVPSHVLEKAASLNESTVSTPLVQTIPVDTSRTESDPVPIVTNEPSPSETSSIELITNDEPQQSCWLRAVNTDIAPPPKAEWDNSVNPIDNPHWMRGSTLPTPDYKGPVAANFRNLPPYKLIGSKSTVITSTMKKAEVTWPAGSFNRQMANIQQTLNPSQPPTSIHQPRTPTSAKALENTASVMPVMEEPKAHLTTPKGTAKVPPHLRGQGTSPTDGSMKATEASKGETNHRPRQSPQSIGHSLANNEDEGIKAWKEPDAKIKDDTPSSHLQVEPTEKKWPVSHSLSPASPSNHEAPASKIDIDEEVAAAQHAVDIENDAQFAAALAAEDPHDDERLAVGLQAGFDDEQVASKLRQMGEHIDTRPPHLRASQQKHKAPALGTETQHRKRAAVQPAPVPQDPCAVAVGTHSEALRDVTRLRQNSKLSSPLDGITPPHEIQSAGKKGKKPASGLDPDNEVSNLVGWDGKMIPALLGEDWEVRAQHDRQSHEKIAGIKIWTEDHAVNPEADVDSVDNKLMSPITITHPITKPNPDEFNQAKRHLNADDRIQAYKAKYSSSMGDTTPSSRGRMSKEEKREVRKRYIEEERNRVYPPNEHAPAANIYLRPAEFKDMRQVCFLHNHYVLKTACAHDLEETNELYWHARLQETIDEHDPFLVAVHMGSKPITNVCDVHRKKSETIVGFAFAADYGQQTHAYRFTVELEMWVHRDHLHQGIGRSMLDRMLAALDPGYNLLECAPFLGKDKMSHWIGGSHCLVKTILVNLLHNEDSKMDVEWKKDWLSSKNEFKYCGTLPGMGHKFGKDVDVAQMVLRTSAALPPSPIS